MSRALPLDLAALVESDGAARANASLRLLRWGVWGEGWSLGATEQEARDLDAMLALDTQAPSRASVAALCAQRLERMAARAGVLRAAGRTVSSVRVECFGLIASLMANAPEGSIGFTFDRNLGVPVLSASAIRRLLVAGAQVRPEDSEESAESFAARSRELYGDESRLVVFDAIAVTPPSITQMPWDQRWSAREVASGAAACVARGTEFECWFASADAGLVEQAIAHLEPGMKSLGMAGPLPEPEVIPEPEPIPEPVVIAEPTQAEQPALSADGEPVAEPIVVPAAPEPPPELGPTEVPEDVVTITVRVPSAQYLPNNGRVFVMFVPPEGRDAMKAEEHITAIAMTEEVRARLKKKKVLAQVNVDVEAVGNSWRIRGISL